MKISPNSKDRVLIYGAGDCGSLVAQKMMDDERSTKIPVVFLDDDPLKRNRQVYGVSVVGGREHLLQITEQFQISEIIIAIPSLPRKALAEIIHACKVTKASIFTMPSLNDLMNGRLSVSDVRHVELEDLLGREPVKLALGDLFNHLRDQVVLVTGAGGSIGSELCRQISAHEPKQLLLLGHGENSIYNIELELRRNFPELDIYPIIADIQQRKRLEQVFARYRPQYVFHAAAHKHVPLMESNPVEAVMNNMFGTKHVADCAAQYKVHTFVLISSDKAVRPSNVMGATKRIAEMYIQQLNENSETQFVSVRFGNVLGSRGSVVPLFKEQIRAGGPVTVTHEEMTRYFMTIPEAVSLVIQAGSLAQGGEVFILDMGKPVRILDLAQDLIRLSGYEPYEDIDIQITGIRPGEKLHEELSTEGEGLRKTANERIYVAIPPVLNTTFINKIYTHTQELLEEDSETLKTYIRFAATCIESPNIEGVVMVP
ncbi:nucleoside-diphosphate sugar epimerase/dehydratase [Paenibacillus terrigena]|uniref:polysaccharide biosynthesis protein n=1 Tax=Paenibacillus terrigena TaxID=369333 RepID=UPI0028D50336|nr:nucleoside-diphosphate sugar epimerase/dehydratase [Paenibacillus terrigena]